MVLARVVLGGGGGGGGGGGEEEGGVKHAHSIARCGTFNCAVLYWSKGHQVKEFVVFTLFRNKDRAIKFLHYLNSRHDSMQFTIEF